MAPPSNEEAAEGEEEPAPDGEEQFFDAAEEEAPLEGDEPEPAEDEAEAPPLEPLNSPEPEGGEGEEDAAGAAGEEAEEAAPAAEDEEEMGIDEQAPDEGQEPPADEGSATADAAPAADQEEDEDDEPDDDEPEVQEHLKDAVEGSLRLKRLLSRDEGVAGPRKRRRKDGEDEPRPIIQAKVRQLMARWQCVNDAVMKHVLDQCSLEELTYLCESTFVPNKFDPRKGAPELLQGHLQQLKEKKLGGGSRVDVVSAFKLRWGLGLEAEKLLRALTHKDLRYVVETYNGSTSLEDVITEASSQMEDEESMFSACPLGSGVKVMGRFNRLELIDPLADCAVFGDANLTFSLNLAKHRKDLGHVGRVIATTFEEVKTLRERYKEIDESIRLLEEHHAEVYHGVDCTRIAIDSRFEGMEGKLGAVYYNFPHSGAIQGFFDSNPMVNWRHENLMRLFFRALRHFVKPGGLVKVSSNSGAVGVRYSFIVGSAVENEFVHVETMPFMEWHLHRYGRSYGDRRDTYKRPDAKNNQSYNAQCAHADMVYCFIYTPSGNTLGKQQIRLPPSLKTLSQCRDGPFKNLPPGPAREKLAKQLHERFIKEVSGTHVG